ncbi:MAG: hypothetical protein QG573_1671 [Acidobacteriota bacterium]|nr:hypothetical protein [Acidobacteriota bacterium]
MIATGLDRLLQNPGELAGRRFGLLAHGASVTADCVPAHLALAAAAMPPARLFGPEHGYYGIEQDMVASASARDPWTGVEIVSLYGDDESSLLPRPEALAGLDLLLIDLQDIGSRYYTYAATAVWAAEAARAAGCEVWILDRPNPLGGEVVEGNLPEPGFASFVGAFRMPVRHGLTLGEIVRLEAHRRQWGRLPKVLAVEGWRRSDLWPATGRPWIAPSPNMPSYETALVYPGLCLLEATELSEGRGTTRPFLLFGAPGLRPTALAEALLPLRAMGVAAVPTYFRPQFQKHCGEVCGGVELVLLDETRVQAYRLGLQILLALKSVAPQIFRWRESPYEFVADRPAIDLLAGSDVFRRTLDGEANVDLQAWLGTFAADEQEFREERREILLYKEERSASK